MMMLVVADPVASLVPETDTTFAIMLEAHRRGHAVYHALVTDLYATSGVPMACASRVLMHHTPAPGHCLVHPPTVLPVASFDAVFIRKDPPVDATYLSALWLLDLASQHTVMVNAARGLLAANEKVYATRFSHWMPETLVTSRFDRVLGFYHDVGEDVILKPLDGHAGAGVLRAQKGDRNLRSIFEQLSGYGLRHVMVQRYLPEARQGDKRILLVAGEPVGAMLRIPAEDDNRGNLRAGAAVHPASPTPREEEMCAALKPALLSDGLLFVGIDVIGERLTEVNVTSPTGARQIARFNGTCPEGILLDAVEKRLQRT
jgi:glutathione synthase